MKNQNFLKKLGDFALGKGFYIVLFLCVAAIGISGYYLIRAVAVPEQSEPVTGNPTVVLPDSEANGPDPAGGIQAPAEPGKQQAEPPDPVQEQPDDPEPLAPTVQPEEPEQPQTVVYTWPVKGAILRDFQVETLALDPTLEDWRTHGGLDLAAALGTKVLAMGTGTVEQVYEDGLMGITVVIEHPDGLTTVYSNLSQETTVEAGQTVETGTVIGTVGESAIAESGLAPHLHLEAWKDETRVNPADYLPAV